MGNTYNRVYIWCCKYGENRYCERCANIKWCAFKHTGLLNSCLGKLCLHPYLVVPLISARVTLISTRVSAHCQAILLGCGTLPMCCHPAFMLSCLCVRNKATTGGQFTKLDRPTGLLIYCQNYNFLWSFRCFTDIITVYFYTCYENVNTIGLIVFDWRTGKS